MNATSISNRGQGEHLTCRRRRATRVANHGVIAAAGHPRGAVEVDAVTVKSVGKLFLMWNEENALTSQVLQFLDHHLPALAIETAETFVDDDGFDRPMLPAGVLADPRGWLTAKRNWLPLKRTSMGLRPAPLIERFNTRALPTPRHIFAAKAEIARQITGQYGVGVIDDAAFGLPQQIKLQM
jgi:hypothetical protein